MIYNNAVGEFDIQGGAQSLIDLLEAPSKQGISQIPKKKKMIIGPEDETKMTKEAYEKIQQA